MTYAELLRTTGERKQKAVAELNSAMANPQLGFLARGEIQRDPGMVAWLWLAKDFCEAIAANLDELLASVEEYERDDIVRIYMAYYDDDPDLYDMLPIEAQLYE